MSCLNRALRYCQDLMYPRQCLLCDGPADQIDLCGPCIEDLPRDAFACARCALPLASPADACGVCQRRPPPYHLTIAAFRYGFPVDAIVLGLKFRRQLFCAEIIADLMADRIVRRLRRTDADLLVPVPLHWRRELVRGFNQSSEIARRLEARLQVTCDERSLRRSRATQAQTRLSPAQRLRNVRSAFVARPERLAGRRVLLIDDVMTTGATLQEAATALLGAGAADVSVAVFARAAAG